MRRGAYATIRDFSEGYELGQGMDCSGLLCVDWQTGNALMLGSAGGYAVWFSVARQAIGRQPGSSWRTVALHRRFATAPSP
jgi:hypothetical protein